MCRRRPVRHRRPATEVAGPRRQPRRKSRRRHGAFTLIELLIVIGIIGILIGILLPVTARARREAKKVACKTRLHDVGAAMQMYLNENRGWYPPARYSAEFLDPDPLKQ